MPHGTVRWFDPDRGFGFLAPDDGAEDLFVHASEVLADDGTRVLREGDAVEFEVGEGPRGPQARRVRVTGGHASDDELGLLGTVSWFEPTKGYGFLAPDGGGAEVFVHGSAVVGGAVLRDGQRVAFLVVPGEKGPQADHVLPLRPGSGSPDPPADGADGTVSWYDVDKGFGFISPDDGSGDVFVHYRALGSLTELTEGDRVAFDVVVGDRGPQARDVRLVRGAGRSGPAPSGRERPGRGGPRQPVRAGEGVVARYDADRGFGFIAPDDGGADLFVHVSVVRGDAPLREGDRVRFRVRQSDRGPQADAVERV